MPLTIPDEVLREANLTERDALVEFLCHLYDRQLIGKGLAARLVGMSRTEFEDELIKRGMPVIRYTEEMFEEDLKTLDYLQKRRTESADDHRK
jgi:predicted HTH domain antitoxin